MIDVTEKLIVLVDDIPYVVGDIVYVEANNCSHVGRITRLSKEVLQIDASTQYHSCELFIPMTQIDVMYKYPKAGTDSEQDSGTKDPGTQDNSDSDTNSETSTKQDSDSNSGKTSETKDSNNSETAESGTSSEQHDETKDQTQQENN